MLLAVVYVHGVMARLSYSIADAALNSGVTIYEGKHHKELPDAPLYSFM